MKISRNALPYDKAVEFDSIQSAVEDALIPNGWSYDGQLEKLQAENEKLREVLSKLIECLYGESATDLNKTETIKLILGYGYEVEL